MSSGFNGSVKNSGVGMKQAFAYRARTGMVPSEEYAVFMDDFILQFIPTTAITNGPVANTPWGWQGAIIDSGATIALNSTAVLGATGVITLADATASEGAAFYGQKSVQLTAGKKFWMEARFRTDDVADNTIQFGLSALTAVTNPEDLWTTTATDLVSFGILDGSATVSMLSDKSNSGSTAETGTMAIAADVFNTLAIYYDGAALTGYVNGKLALRWAQAAATIPNGVALAPFFGHLNGNGAGGNVVALDFIRIVSER